MHRGLRTEGVAAHKGLHQGPLRIRQIRGVGLPESSRAEGLMPRAIDRVSAWGNRMGRTARVPRNKAVEQAEGSRAARVLLVYGRLLGERDISRLPTLPSTPSKDGSHRKLPAERVAM
jgi:hypothetical protein